MSAILRSLSSHFRKSPHLGVDVEEGGRSSQRGPYSTGTSSPTSSPTRRRTFWRRASAGFSDPGSPDTIKSNGKGAKAEKMGTIDGVFIPTTLNVLSILMYLRVNYSLLNDKLMFLSMALS